MTTRLVGAFAIAVALMFAGCGGGREEAPAGPVAPILGYGEVFQPGQLDPELIERSGAEIGRRPLNWTSVEPSPGEFDWSLYDQVDDEMQAAGLEPLWVVTSAPCWAAADPGCKPDQPSYAPARENFDDFAAFVAAVAERYPDSAGIEVWNEPNLERFFIGSGGPKFYAEMLTATADAVAATETGVPVVAAGLSPVVESGPERTEWTGYLAEVLAGGGLEAVDAIGLHPYSVFEPGRSVAPKAERMISEAEAALAAAEVELPIWITEVGVSTAGKSSVDPESQAAELAELYAIALARSIPVMIVHRLYDQLDPEFPVEAGYGVVEADMTTPKPAFCRLAELVAAPGCPDA